MKMIDAILAEMDQEAHATSARARARAAGAAVVAAASQVVVDGAIGAARRDDAREYRRARLRTTPFPSRRRSSRPRPLRPPNWCRRSTPASRKRARFSAALTMRS